MQCKQRVPLGFSREGGSGRSAAVRRTRTLLLPSLPRLGASIFRSRCVTVTSNGMEDNRYLGKLDRGSTTRSSGAPPKNRRERWDVRGAGRLGG